MSFPSPHHCAFCLLPIEPDQRWVREKIYDSSPSGHHPAYRRYHADLFDGQQLCCWEKHQMQLQISRTDARAA